MSDMEKSGHSFVGYEYKEISVARVHASMFLDGYENFGWIQDENMQPIGKSGKVSIRLKRDRKIVNKMELTRLQRNFEACMSEIEVLEASKTSTATVASLMLAFIGTAFMAGATFAVTHEPPIIWLCVVLAIPGILGWAYPPFLHKAVLQKKTELVAPFIEEKQNEVYHLCEKGNKLLHL